MVNYPLLLLLPLTLAGILELRQGICDLHQRHDKLTLDPSQVVVAPGTKELIYLLMSIFNGGRHNFLNVCVFIFNIPLTRAIFTNAAF